MNSSAATEAYARGIYNAFAAYKKRHSGGINVPYLPEPKSDKVEIPQIVPQKQETAEQEKPVEKPKKEVVTEPLKPEPQPEAVPQEEIPGGVDLSVVKEKAPIVKDTVAAVSDAPVFKVQILVSSSKLKAGDARLKGLENVDSYTEGGLQKYTVGASTDYNEIYRLRKGLLDKFPEAFIIAFRQDAKMNVQEAIRVFRNRKK